MFLKVKNLKELSIKWEAGLMNKMWKDEKLKKYFSPIRKRLGNYKFPWKTNKDIKNPFLLMDGNIILAVTDIDFNSLLNPLSCTVLIDVKNTKLRAFVRSSEKQFIKAFPVNNMKASTHRGKLIKTMQIKEGQNLSWCITDKELILSNNIKSVRESIDLLFQKEKSIIHTKQYESVSKKTKKTDCWLFLNFKNLMPLTKPFLTAICQNEVIKELAISAKSILDGLGLEKIDAISYSINLEKQKIRSRFEINFNNEGLVKLLNDDTAKPVILNFIPATADKITVLNLSPDKILKASEKTVKTISSVIFKTYTAGLDSINKSLGLNLKKDVFSKMGDSVIIFSNYKNSQKKDSVNPLPLLTNKSFVMAFSLKEQDQFKKTILSLKDGSKSKNKLFKIKNYKNYNIFYLTNNNGKNNIHCTVTNHFILVSIGDISLLKNTLDMIDTKNQNFLGQSGINKIAKLIPQDAAGYTIHSNSHLKEIINTFNQTNLLLDEGNFVDPKFNPDIKILKKYFKPWISYFYLKKSYFIHESIQQN